MAGTDGGARVGANDVLRFGLELAALASLGYWGWTAAVGGRRVALAVGLPLVAAVLWGVFRVPGDPGPAPVAVPGFVRLGLEGTLFAAAVLGLVDANRPVLAAGLAALLLVHYLAARERVRRLLGLAAG